MSDEHNRLIDATAMAALATDPADKYGQHKLVLSAVLAYADALRRSSPYMPSEEVNKNSVLYTAAVLNRMTEIKDAGGGTPGTA